jgi:hypothetical protein
MLYRQADDGSGATEVVAGGSGFVSLRASSTAADDPPPPAAAISEQ